ncbi:helix-turn-helix domain-containing protein [Fontivita pretiosa]|uniref:helix-turn-helix domain-containing protein n=1 Tax=Fontivita pretiosa TaxID=2989684 RepID=UPI003D164ACF
MSTNTPSGFSAARPAPPRLLLTPREAAAALAISERSLWNLAQTGQVRRLKIGRAVRYDVRDIEAFIARRKEVPRD